MEQKTSMRLERMRRVQKRLGKRIDLSWDGRPIHLVAGADVAYGRNDTASAGIAVLKYPEMSCLELRTTSAKVTFPYIPGFFSFREVPPLLRSVKKLVCPPDVILCDGHGIAHPERFGLACHLGILLGIPTIGCAGSRLTGSHEIPSGDRGAEAGLLDHQGNVIGAVVRTRSGTRPVYISPGHLMDLKTAVRIVLACCPKYRVPEPLRLAHQHAAAALRDGKGQ